MREHTYVSFTFKSYLNCKKPLQPSFTFKMLSFVVVLSALACVANARPQTFDTSKEEAPFTFDVSKNPYAFAFDGSNDPYAYTFDVSKDPYAYAYNAEKDPYVYKYDPAKDQFAGQNGGSAGSASIGELLDTLNVLTKSTLFTELLNLGDNDCQVLPEPEIISEANAAVQARRGELEAAFR